MISFIFSYQRSSIGQIGCEPLGVFVYSHSVKQSDLVSDHVGLRGVFYGGACHSNDCIGTV